jgi:hypothetical protein
MPPALGHQNVVSAARRAIDFKPNFMRVEQVPLAKRQGLINQHPCKGFVLSARHDWERNRAVCERASHNPPDGQKRVRLDTVVTAVGRTVLCSPPRANRRVDIHRTGAHGVTRPTCVNVVCNCYKRPIILLFALLFPNQTASFNAYPSDYQCLSLWRPFMPQSMPF